MEAMAAGLPVVSTDVGGIPEVVRAGETGLLVPARDPQAMANAIDTLFTNLDLRIAMGAAGRQAIRRFSWDAITDQYVDFYERRPARRKGGR